MKGRGLILGLFVVFIGLLALSLLTNSTQETPSLPTTTVRLRSVFEELAVTDLQAIRLRSPETGTSLILARGDDGGWIAPDHDGILDAESARAIARTIVLLPYTTTQPIPPIDQLPVYGFMPEGILALEVLLFSGEAHAVAIGYRTPTETSYYAIVDGEDMLYVLERAAVDFLIAMLRNPPIA